MSEHNQDNNYNKKNKRTDIVFILLLVYFISMFIVNIFLFLPLGKETIEMEQEQIAQKEQEIKYTYYISFNKGNLNEYIKSNSYKIENGLIYVEAINHDGSTTNYVLNIDNYSIVDKSYIVPDNFKPQYYVCFYDNVYNEYLYCDTVEYQENNAIIVTTNNKKVYLYGNYKVKELTEEEILEWLEKYGENNNQNIEENKNEPLTNNNNNDII